MHKTLGNRLTMIYREKKTTINNESRAKLKMR